MSSRKRHAVTLACLVCGLVLIPAHLEGKPLQEAGAAALQHAQGHVREAGVGSGRTLAGVNYWRVYAQTGGR